MPEDKVRPARGRPAIFTGRKAKEVGLVDENGRACATRSSGPRKIGGPSRAIRSSSRTTRGFWGDHASSRWRPTAKKQGWPGPGADRVRPGHRVRAHHAHDPADAVAESVSPSPYLFIFSRSVDPASRACASRSRSGFPARSGGARTRDQAALERVHALLERWLLAGRARRPRPPSAPDADVVQDGPGRERPRAARRCSPCSRTFPGPRLPGRASREAEGAISQRARCRSRPAKRSQESGPTSGGMSLPVARTGAGPLISTTPRAVEKEVLAETAWFPYVRPARSRFVAADDADVDPVLGSSAPRAGNVLSSRTRREACPAWTGRASPTSSSSKRAAVGPRGKMPGLEARTAAREGPARVAEEARTRPRSLGWRRSLNLTNGFSRARGGGHDGLGDQLLPVPVGPVIMTVTFRAGRTLCTRQRHLPHGGRPEDHAPRERELCLRLLVLPGRGETALTAAARRPASTWFHVRRAWRK